MNNYVTMEYKQCPVCGTLHTHDCGVLIDMKMRDIEPNHEGKVVTGLGYCKKHQKLADDDFVTLVECDNTHGNDTLKMEDANRTGNVGHIKRHIFNDIFDVDLPSNQDFLFADSEVLDMIQAMQPE